MLQVHSLKVVDHLKKETHAEHSLVYESFKPEHDP